MTDIVIRVRGGAAEEQTRNLRSELNDLPDSEPSTVEVTRVGSVVAETIAVLSTTVAGIDFLRVLWSWWTTARSADATVRILLPDGGEVHLDDVSEAQLESILDRYLPASFEVQGGVEEE